MNCYYHNDEPADVICGLCNQPVCSKCKVEISGKNYCQQCVGERISKGGDRVIIKKSVGFGTRFFVFLLSMVPGVGYLYLGLMNRGMQTLIVAFSSIFLASFLEFGPFAFLVLPVIGFYTIFDTQHILSKVKEGYGIKDELIFDWDLIFKGAINYQKAIAVGLILIGFMGLLTNLPLNNTVVFYLKQLMVPILIIGTGCYILFRTVKGEKVE